MKAIIKEVLSKLISCPIFLLDIFSQIYLFCNELIFKNDF